MERTNNEISGETKAMNKDCTKTTSALSFFFFFARFLIYLFAASYQLGREWPTSNNNIFMAKQCHAIFLDVTFTSCDYNVFVVEHAKKKTLIITETVQTFQVIAIYLTFFRGINLEICYALYL